MAIRSEVENIALREKQRQMEAAQLERAKQDRVALVEQAVARAGERYGFELPVAKFSRLFSLEWETDKALAQVDEWFAAEAERRNPVQPVVDEAKPEPVQYAPQQPTVDQTRALNVRIAYKASQHSAVMQAVNALREIGVVTISQA